MVAASVHAEADDKHEANCYPNTVEKNDALFLDFLLPYFRRKTSTSVKTFSSPYFGSKKKQIGVVKANVKSDGSLGGVGVSVGSAKSGSTTPEMYLRGVGKAPTSSAKGSRQNSADLPDKDNTQISFGSMPSYR